VIVVVIQKGDVDTAGALRYDCDEVVARWKIWFGEKSRDKMTAGVSDMTGST